MYISLPNKSTTFINHPIINDELYSNGINIKSFHQKYRSDIQTILKKINRVALHSYSLNFIHPTTKKTVKLNAPLPCDFKNAIDVIVNLLVWNYLIIY